MSLYKSLKKSIRENMPSSLWGHLSRARSGLKGFVRWNFWKLRHPGNDFFCPYCKSEFGKFIPYVNPYEITQKVDIVSGKSIEDYACPRCFSNDRERLLYFFIERNKGVLATKKVLHFAPERNLYSLISSAGCDKYVCADLDTKNYLHFSKQIEKIDLTKINYPDESFDVVICNHVMEHIPDDVHAMKEIRRVLKKSGFAILMVPIGAKLEDTYEDFSKVTEEERSIAFGQYDHVRVYAEQNYLERLQSAGFETDNILLDMDEKQKVRCGINPREKIYLCFKNRDAASKVL